MLMMELLVQDFPYSSIVSDLNEKGFRMRNGRPWSRVARLQYDATPHRGGAAPVLHRGVEEGATEVCFVKRAGAFLILLAQYA